MNPIQILEKDHRSVEQLFARYERAHEGRDVAELRRTVREIVRELSVHAAIEEQLVYPALRAAGVQDDVLDALEEHHAVKLTLAELEVLAPRAERFAAKMRLVIENVRAHVKDEEARLLPRLARTLDAEALRDLGTALLRAKRAAPTRPHPAMPDSPPGNFVTGAVAALVDRSRDALRGGAEVTRAVLGMGAAQGASAARATARRAGLRGRRAMDSSREAYDATVASGREAVEGARRIGDRAFEAVEAGAGRGMRRVQEGSAALAREVRPAKRRKARRPPAKRTSQQRAKRSGVRAAKKGR